MNLNESRVVLVNDDGIDEIGLSILEQTLRRFTKNYCIVAPTENQSGRARATSYGDTVTLHRLAENRYSVSGTPADCALIAISVLGQEYPFDLVISGVNDGANVADDITASGTIGACLQGATMNVPGIAISQNWLSNKQSNWHASTVLLPELLPRLVQTIENRRMVLNVNLPVLSEGSSKASLAVVKAGYRIGPVSICERESKTGDRCFKIRDIRSDVANESGCDLDMVNRGYVVVTPLTLDQTDYNSLDALSALLMTN